MRSGFATIVGRPNAGKSTLLNRILGRKVSIVSDKPNTTRSAVRGILHHPDGQVVFVDTPGLHKPRSLLGKHLNLAARSSLSDVDVAIMVVDAAADVGRGDAVVASSVPADAAVVLNKADTVDPGQLEAQRSRLRALGLTGPLMAVSARTGEGVDTLVQSVLARMPDGPPYYPEHMVSDVGEGEWVAELVREQLLAVVDDELPHAIACQVTEWEWPRVRVEILVERDSQKGIVIGSRGQVLKAVGTAVRQQMDPGAYLELFVRVDKDWQRRSSALARLGL
ncbi:MAG: GTPase Era [Actinomycetota bacterium]|nr:GTPase Era [Actinomycetota bacterium]